jgi:transcriptional regulator with XRE-family HTH domain
MDKSCAGVTGMIGGRLKEARLAKGMTQAELGRLVGVGKSAVSQYEGGLREPETAVLIRLAGALGVTTDWLLGFAGRAGMVGEDRPEYHAVPDADAAGWQAYLRELTREVGAIQSPEDRRAVLELARFLAQKAEKKGGARGKREERTKY